MGTWKCDPLKVDPGRLELCHETAFIAPGVCPDVVDSLDAVLDGYSRKSSGFGYCGDAGFGNHGRMIRVG